MFTLKTDAIEIHAELCDVIRLFTDDYDLAHYEIEFWIDKDSRRVRLTDSAVSKPDPARASAFKRTAKNALYRALRAHFGREMPWGSLTGIRPSKLVYDYLNGLRAGNYEAGCTDDEGIVGVALPCDPHLISRVDGAGAHRSTPPTGKDVAELNSSEYSSQMLKGIPEKLARDYFVSPLKAALIAQIVQNQRGYYTRDPNFVNLYVHIPFCPSRCNYCSFVSVPVDKQRKLVEPYVEKLCAEIAAAKELIQKTNRKVYSVYIGGGTPTVLGDELFSRVLEATEGITKNFGRDKAYLALCLQLEQDVFGQGTPCPYKKSSIQTVQNPESRKPNPSASQSPITIHHPPNSPLRGEFTCEAGRPETITPEKLAIMKRCGVTRVSVNPQSLNDATLLSIGREHTEKDFYGAFGRVREAGFIINVDLIAGLAAETPADFARTLQKIAALRPENITVHTLSRKRGSALKEQAIQEFAGGITEMTDCARDFLTGQGYLPYYLYRQKQMLENLENVGYSLPGFQCVNNITVMEEMLSVVAIGAGAISKLVLPRENRIERLANPKDVKLYLERFDEILDKKGRFFLSFPKTDFIPAGGLPSAPTRLVLI
ncbi:MAG: radical SAM protein [Firmicutes bacterium]|nr:radical SAM protein [Bacillota bacterium]